MSKKKAYVIGTNVNTSMSPTIFQYWFDKYNVNAEYRYKEIQETNFDQEIKNVLKEDGLVGLNITMPFKERVIPHLTLTKNKETKLPINCITIDGDEIIGKNTDVDGFKKALCSKLDTHYTTRSGLVIVLGYGGAAKAIIHSLLSMGFDYIMVFNRTFDKIKNIKQISTKKDAQSFAFKVEPQRIEEISKKIHRAGLVVNTTPINMLEDSSNLEIGSNCIGFDVVYRPWEGTGFLKNFKPENRIEGIQMLVYQAAPCFHEWFGINPEVDEGLFKTLYKKMSKQK